MADTESSVTAFPSYGELTRSEAWAATQRSIGGSELGSDQLVDAATRYTAGALLGMGGMGKVTLVRDARIGRDVAVKQLRGDRELSAEDRARFLREARVQGQLEHPSIVPVYDIDAGPDGTTYFTMRRVVGRTLHAVVEDLRARTAAALARYTQRELLTAFATICLTVDYAHSRGVIHRDLKPANIMLGDFAEVYVLDWGLARVVEDSMPSVPAERLSMPGAIMGTMMYMAPEQMMDPAVGPRADVFSLGAILFELLTYEPLRDPASPLDTADARPSVRAPARMVAPELEAICVRATASDPDARYPSARALQEAVVRYLDGDRELELRKSRAAAHARAARAAASRAAANDEEADRGVAMREIVRALAFEPTNGEHIAVLAEIMQTPPRHVPDEVRRDLDARTQQFLRAVARSGLFALLAFAAFVPIVLAFGVREPSEALQIVIPYGIAGLLTWIATRQAVVSPVVQYGVYAATIVGIMATSRMYGPLVMVPTLASAYAISLQIHPHRSIRYAVQAMVCAAVLVVPLLELAGVFRSSYSFEDGRLVIAPQMIDLPRSGTFVLLIGSTIAQTVTACAFVGRLRHQLTVSEQQQAVQTWHFRRLGSELLASGDS